MAATISYLERISDNTNRTLYTFSGANFGTADSKRRIIVVASLFGGNQISSVTIGGISTTIIFHVAVGVEGNYHGIFIAAVPTGANGDIIVDSAGTADGCTIFTYTTYDINSNIPTDTATSIADPGVVDIDVTPGGVVIAVSIDDDGNHLATWTNLTEDYDAQISGGDDISGASGAFVAAQTNLAITCQWSASPGDKLLLVASFASNPILDAGAGTFTINGQDTKFQFFSALYTMVAIVGTYIVTGFNTLFRRGNSKWKNKEKHTSIWKNKDKS